MTTTSTSRRSSSRGGAALQPSLRLGPAAVLATGRADGDLGDRQAQEPWAWARQVHGATALVVGAPGCAGEADALATDLPGLPLVVRAADCAPLALAAGRPGGPAAVGVAHGGWQGLAAGVVAAAADALRSLVDEPVAAWLGPCVRPCCYEFGADDLDRVAAALGDDVRATTSWGAPALDVPAAVAAACRAAGARLVGADGRCTACARDAEGTPALFSHRARADAGRHGVVAWLP